MLQRSLLATFVTCLVTFASAQQSATVQQPKLTPQVSGTTQLLIAVSPVNSQIVWAAGTGGTYVLTTTCRA